MEKMDLIDSVAAAEMLKVSRSQAVRLLGEPDDIEPLFGNSAKFLYRKCRVEALVQLRECERCLSVNGEHYHRCRSCQNKFKPCELTSGKCPECRAFDMCRNYACHGDCFKCPRPDGCLIANLESAVLRLKALSKSAPAEQ
jgi:hypothetical protein